MILYVQDLKELDNISAYFKNKPIRKKKQMPTEIGFIPVDKKWKDYINEQCWLAYYEGYADEMAELLKLRRLLLSFGGGEVKLPNYEEDLKKIMARGQFWYGDRVVLMPGERGQCHRNTCRLWEKNKDKVLIATGYALSEDGVWRQHSWGIQVRPRRNRVVETTAKRIAYFGFVMNQEESEEFAYYNM